MAYGDLKVFRDKRFNNTKNPKHEGFQPGITSMVCKFFGKNLGAAHKKTEINSGVVSENQKLGEELHKPIIGKFKK